MIKCKTCKNKTDMSEGELYCMSEYGIGEVYDWCDAYNSALEYMKSIRFDFDKCEGYESNNI